MRQRDGSSLRLKYSFYLCLFFFSFFKAYAQAPTSSSYNENTAGFSLFDLDKALHFKRLFLSSPDHKSMEGFPTPILPKVAHGKVIQAIHFLGNKRTDSDLLSLSLSLAPGQIFTEDKLSESVQNIKNLQVFADVYSFIVYADSAHTELTIYIVIEEKWTFIPYVLAGSGGGASYFVAGIYDTNFLGRLYTFNMAYGCKNSSCSEFLYFKNPNLFSSPFSFVLAPYLQHNVYYIYDDDRNTIGAFANQQTMVSSYSEYRANSQLSFGVGVLYINNQITNKGLTFEDEETNQFYGYAPPPSTQSMALESRLTLGSINYDGVLLMDGTMFVSILDSTLQILENSNDNYTAINNTLTSFKPFLFRNAYLAFRGNLSFTTSSVTSQQYFLGGLDKIRGFFDNEFVGNKTWFTNAEFRIPTYMDENIAIQNVFFSDAGNAVNDWNDFFVHPTAINTGVGARLIFLKVSKIALRVDWAYTLHPFNAHGFSFGFFQFF